MSCRVLIVDDSGFVRKLLTEVLSTDPEIEVVGTARDPYEARELIKQLSPHVLTLDVEMPRMDGISFLGNLMRLRPMPVVMVSSLTAAGADATMAALQLGAVDFVTKPSLDLAAGLQTLAGELVAKVKSAARANVAPRPSTPARVQTAKVDSLQTTDRVIAIGASTGGTEAIATVLEAMPPDAPAIVIAQHIPETFSAHFAARLNRDTNLVVREASDGAPLLTGHVYVAPGGKHLRVERSGLKYFCAIGEDEPVNRHRPSVDVLFDSVARNVGRNAVGVLLTGMGADGAVGLLAMKQAGAPTIAQDKETSVVWGMPGEAIKRGAAGEVLPLSKVCARALGLARSSRAAA
ncbi:MAG: chemotaxis response regulator protein-glutamate methylesterase [Myxococcaceae bacterium]|jgi:two-component system chemotaxis response regulator CheB|nr:chemotaxis response regulator protein-glutamate methylesterase [Myxococcaceae bacterium]